MGSAGLKVNEPSMEEILASIRRIIADDEALQSPEIEEPASSPLKNVLDIAELHMSPLVGSGANESVLGPWSRGEALLDDQPAKNEGIEHLQVSSEPAKPAPAPIVIPQSPAVADA